MFQKQPGKVANQPSSILKQAKLTFQPKPPKQAKMASRNTKLEMFESWKSSQKNPSDQSKKLNKSFAMPLPTEDSSDEDFIRLSEPPKKSLGLLQKQAPLVYRELIKALLEHL